MVDYQEAKTLEAICAHHGTADPELIEHLAQLIEWVHQSEQAKHGGQQPCFLLVLEGLMGLHTKRQPKKPPERRE